MLLFLDYSCCPNGLSKISISGFSYSVIIISWLITAVKECCEIEIKKDTSEKLNIVIAHCNHLVTVLYAVRKSSSCRPIFQNELSQIQ